MTDAFLGNKYQNLKNFFFPCSFWFPVLLVPGQLTADGIKSQSSISRLPFLGKDFQQCSLIALSAMMERFLSELSYMVVIDHMLLAFKPLKCG